VKTSTRSLLLAAALFIAYVPSSHAQEADLLVEKFGPAESAEDTDVSYTVTITNVGPDAAVDVTLSDGIPAGMEFTSGSQVDGPTFICTYPTPGDTSGTIVCTNALFAAGSVANFTFTFHIPAGTPPGTSFTNIATASTTTFDPNEENNSGIAGTTTPIPPQSDLGVTKDGPPGAAPGQNVQYTIVLTNGGGAATNVVLTDTLPGTMTFVSLVHDSPLSCTTPAVGSGGTITCTGASYPAGQTSTFVLTGNIPAGSVSGEEFQNIVTVSADNDSNEENNSSSTQLMVSQADLAVLKAGPTSVAAGEEIAFTITVTNNGPDAASDATLLDMLPPNTTFVSLVQNTGPTAVCSTPPPGSGGTVSCTWTFLASGASPQFTLTLETGNTTSVANTATVSSNAADSNTGNNSSTATTTVTPNADLAVTKTGPSTATAGGTVTYTVTVTNEGPSDATNVSLTDAVPANATFASRTQTTGPAFTCTDPPVGGTGTITCTIATFAEGASATFQIVMNVSPAAQTGNTVINIATVTSETADADGSDNTATSTATVAVDADLSVTKTGPTSAPAGANITYTVTVANGGPSDAASVTLTDNTPANTTFVSLTQTGGPTFSCSTPAVGGTGPITCSIASLVSGASASFEIVVDVADGTASGTAIVNTATVTSTTSDSDPSDNSASSTATVSEADLSITKLGPNTVGPGLTAAYDITVTNDGPSSAVSVTLTDILPANTTFNSFTPAPGWACTTPPSGSPGTVTCTIAVLAAGVSANFDLVVNIDADATGTIVNTATVTSPSDPATSDNASTTSAALAVEQVPALSPAALAALALALSAIVLFVLRR